MMDNQQFTSLMRTLDRIAVALESIANLGGALADDSDAATDSAPRALAPQGWALRDAATRGPASTSTAISGSGADWPKIAGLIMTEELKKAPGTFHARLQQALPPGHVLIPGSVELVGDKLHYRTAMQSRIENLIRSGMSIEEAFSAGQPDTIGILKMDGHVSIRTPPPPLAAVESDGKTA